MEWGATLAHSERPPGSSRTKDIADLLVPGELKGEVRKMTCKSKIGKTIYIAKAGTKTLIGQVTVNSCTPISYEKYLNLFEEGVVGMCGTPDPTKKQAALPLEILKACAL